MALPPLFITIVGRPGNVRTMFRDVGNDIEGLSKKGATNFDKLAKVGQTAFKAVAVGGAAAAVATVHMAADFQQGTSRLVTDGGEAADSLKKVQNGILNMMGPVGDSSAQLVDAMNTIESAGFHAAQGGLDVLKTAAEGAKVGNADLQTTANALTSALNAYGLSASHSTEVMNQMISTVAAGKMHMQDLASSLSNVLPVAAAAHISFAEVGGAIATMTSQGMSAQQATQDLANTIRSLQNPNGTAIKEMTALGLNANHVADDLGKKGLTGTLEDLTTAIAHHVKGGDVFINTLKSSKIAAADLQTMLKQLPKNVQKLGQEFLNGQLSQKQWTAALKGLPPLQANLAKQFATTAKQANGFNDLLKSGTPQAQTMTAALSDMLGGATGLNTALMLTGDHMATFQSNVKSVADAAHEGGGQVKDWATVQKNFNQQLDQAKAQAEALGIKIGTALLPWAEKMLHATMDLVHWFGQHKGAAEALAAVIAGVLAVAIGAYFLKLGKNLISSAKDLAKFGSDTVKAFSKAGGALADGIGKVGDFASTAKSALSTAGSAISKAATQLGELASAGASRLATLGSTIAEWASSAASAMASAGRALWGYAVKLGEMAAEAAASFATMAADALVWAGEMLAAGVEAMIPFLPIIAAVAAVAAAAYLMYKYWDKIWAFVKAIVLDAYHWIRDHLVLVAAVVAFPLVPLILLWKNWDRIWGEIKAIGLAAWHFLYDDVFQPIVKFGLWYIKTEITILRNIWEAVWNGLKTAALTVWHALDSDVLQPIVKYGIDPIRDGIDELKRVWDSAWGEIKRIAHAAWSEIGPVLGDIESAGQTIMNIWSALNGSNAGAAGGAIGSGVSSFLSNLPHKKDGGWVPGSPGQPVLIVAHGGEYVLSQDMLAGNVSTGLGPSGSAAGGGIVIINNVGGSVIAQTELTDAFQEVMTQLGMRNSTSYTAYQSSRNRSS